MRIVLAALLALCASGCGDSPAAEAPVTVASASDDLLAELAGSAYPDAGPTRIRFEDVSATAGIDAVNHSGRKGVKEFLLEAVGPGLAWLDYDGDGDQDLYVPDGDEFRNYTLVRVTDPATGRQRPLLQPKPEKEVVFTDSLWRNEGDGTFTDVSAEAGIADDRWSFGVTVFDYEGDGDPDLFVANLGLDRLWRNNGDGTFTDIAVDVGLAGEPWAWSTCATVGDVDGDGRLDLYVPRYADPAAEVETQRVAANAAVGTPPDQITGRRCRWRGILAYCGPIGLVGQHDAMFRQREDGTFEDMAEAWGMRPTTAQYGFTATMFDFNGDGLLDVLIANDSVENFMWQQSRGPDGAVRFRDKSDTLGVKYGHGLNAQASMGLAIADIDRDGHFDIGMTNFSHDYNNIWRGQGTPEAFFYQDRGLKVMGQAVYHDLAWGMGWIDFDNDADLDLYIANGHVYKEIDLFTTGTEYDQLNALFECMVPDQMGYREIGRKAQERPLVGVEVSDLEAGDGTAVRKCSRAAAFADWNNDGRMEIVVGNMNDVPTVLLNTSREVGQWIKVELVQPGGNREALGALVAVQTADARQLHPVFRGTSFLGSNDTRMHFGLGAATTCDVTVRWPGPDGGQTTFEGLAAGALYRLHRASAEAERVELKAFDVAR